MVELAMWGSVLTFEGGLNPRLGSPVALTDGRILMTWRAGSSNEIYATILNADGSESKPTWTIAQPQGDNVGVPRVAALSNGDFVVVYHERVQTNYYTFTCKRFTSGGVELGQTVVLKNIGVDPNESVVATPNGGFAITYHHSLATTWQTGQIVFDGQGKRTDSLIYQPDSDDTYIFRDTEGLINGLYVTLEQRTHWTGTTFEYSLVFDLRSNGAQLPPYSITIGAFEGNKGNDAQVVALSTGHFAIVWTSSTDGIIGQIFNGGGSAATGIFSIDGGTGTTSFDLAQMSDGKFGVVYVKNGATTVSIVTGTGAVETSSINIGPNSDHYRAITPLNDGRLLVQWLASNNKFQAQIFDPRTAAVDWTGDDSGQQYGGTKFGDYLRGAGGNDTLFGGDGDDALSGGEGHDRLDGGLGRDMATYQDAPVALGGAYVDLSGDSNNDGAAFGDVLIGIEDVKGTSQGDVIIGIRGDNGIGSALYGGGGNDFLKGQNAGDVLQGEGGDDILEGGAGGDELYGGAGGWDLATYINTVGQGVTVDLSDNTKNAGGALGDKLFDIEVVQGSNQSDTLTSVDRGGGNGAELHGAGGNDTLIGKGGGDRLYGEEGDDILQGGTSGDELNGGKGWDLVTYIDITDQGVIVDLSGGTSNGLGALGDTLIDIEAVQGTNQADSLVSVDRGGGNGAELHGAGGADILVGMSAGDRLYGDAGNDNLNGGGGNDILDGGGDTDTAVFSGLRSAYTVTYNQSGGTFTVTGQDGTDRLKNIEWVQFDDVTEALTAGTENHDPDSLTFLDDTNTASVDADAVAPVLGTLKARDPDTGQTLSFMIDALDPNWGKFTITNGNELAVTSGTLAAGTYTVRVRVSDGNGGELVKDFTIISNPVGPGGNHVPNQLKLNGGTAVTVNENAGFAGALSAQDVDGDNNFTWTFDDTVAGNANALFEIDNSGSGNKQLKLKAGIDYEALPAGQKYVTVYLKAADDKGGTSTTQAFKINIADLDEAPTNHAPTNLSLFGNAAAEYALAGTQVGTLSASDANNDPLSYALIDNAGGRFMLSGNRIMVADGFRLDFEQARSHNVIVQVSDGRGGVAHQTFAIAVNDINPEFTTGTAGNDVFHGGAMNDVLRGNLGHDRLFGGAGKDSLKGEAGNDTIGGGAGPDKLYGTKGRTSRDAFVFDTKLTSKSVAKKNRDTIYDFGPKYDSIFFDDAVFTNKTIAKYLKGKGASLDHAYKMKSSFFRVGDKAHDRNDFFIAKKVKSSEYKLYWDADGSGSKAMLEIGTVKLQKGEGKTLTYKDFFFI